MSNRYKRLLATLWDMGCAASLIGIWPRFIEPNLLSKTTLTLPLRGIPKGHRGIRLIQLSDLHISRYVQPRFLKRILKTIDRFQPDLIVLTGDLLCRSELTERPLLSHFLRSLSASAGIFAIPGNHDYSEYLFVNREGDYDSGVEAPNPLKASFSRFFERREVTGRRTKAAHAVSYHSELLELLQDARISLLQNKTVSLDIEGAKINVTGLGEWMAGKCDPERAFRNYNAQKGGIVLVHNPDAIPSLTQFPGDLLLSGHTHGGSIRIPGIWQKLLLTEQIAYIKGLYQVGEKKVYVSRGLGGTVPFRCFCPPEIVQITLQSP